MMDLIDLSSSKPLSSLQRPDLIEYNSEYVPSNIFVVYSTDYDGDIPALMIQLWKFSGGYNHAIYNVVVNDLAINNSVKVLQPQILIGKIVSIDSYREIPEPRSEKEKFILNLKPKDLKQNKDEFHPFPFECTVITEVGEKHVHIPEWTPLQKIPVDRIGIDSIVELWCANNICTLMRVLKL